MEVREQLSSASGAYEYMKAKLASLEPDYEIRHKAELVAEIEALKRQRQAVILGHNYMEAALYHTVADYTGDSLELSRLSAEIPDPVLVFCGVVFMAETAKILAPQKTVLVPSLDAGCSLAASITAEDVRNLRKQFPGVPVVTYVNSYAEVKAESDACCTSGNAADVVRSFGGDSVIFLPDEYLARNVAKETGMEVIFPTLNAKDVQEETQLHKVMVSWRGRCEVHDLFKVDDIKAARAQYPNVKVLAHPECPPEVVEAADFTGSTKKMINYVSEHQAEQYLLLTECSMGDNIIAEHPQKNVLRMCSFRCPHMNQISLQQTLESLKQMRFEVIVEESVRLRAKVALDYMLRI